MDMNYIFSEEIFQPVLNCRGDLQIIWVEAVISVIAVAVIIVIIAIIVVVVVSVAVVVTVILVA